jgi:hypothetical protein
MKMNRFLKKCMKCGRDFYIEVEYKAHIVSCKGTGKGAIGQADHEGKPVADELLVPELAQIHINDMTLEQLKAHAAKQNIKGSGSMGKGQLLAALASQEQIPAAGK